MATEQRVEPPRPFQCPPSSSWYRSGFLLRYWCSYVAVARWVVVRHRSWLSKVEGWRWLILREDAFPDIHHP